MNRVLVVGEDALCCVLGEQLVTAALPGWTLARASINAGGITKLVPNLDRYAEQARYVQPVVCIADTDGRCPVELRRQWLPNPAPRLALRLAVTEAESWLLADRQTLAAFLAVPIGNIPDHPDDVLDPKRTVLALARRSKKRQIRVEMVSARFPEKQGSGYNLHLGTYVRTRWRAAHAATCSPSLARAIDDIAAMAAVNG